VSRHPFSNLASREAEAYLERYLEATEQIPLGSNLEDSRLREVWDDVVGRPGLVLIRDRFPITSEDCVLNGVSTQIFTPVEGVSEANRGKVLLSMHGGGYRWGAGPTAHVEAIPVASVGAIEVVSVDYRLYPEHCYPAAIEDVASVYEALLETHRPEDIGLYGCSAGGWLTAQAIPWFAQYGLPRPGGVGIFCSGGMATFAGADGRNVDGDSRRWVNYFNDDPLPDPTAVSSWKDPYYGDHDIAGPLISPVLHPDVLAEFPPTLLLSGTRDFLLSRTLVLHSRLIAAGVDARLHVWEGIPHCAQTMPFADLGVPELWEIWSVTGRFFTRVLGDRDVSGVE
jgi:acetyl esterase/lipase